MRVNSIQFLRAVAALLLVYEHSMDVQIHFGTSFQQKLYSLANFGCIGVDLFFVISGYIIMYTANKYTGLHEGIHFLQKRFYRINPVYYIATTLFLVFYIIRLNIVHFPFLNYAFNKTIDSLIDSLVIIPTSGDINSFSPLLLVGWSLSFEWLFYLLFFGLILCNVKQKTIFLPSLILLLIGIGKLLKPDDLRLQFITNPILLEFVLGVIICQLHLSLLKIRAWVGALFLAAGLISYLLLIRFGYGDIWYYLNTITGKSSLTKFLLWGFPSGFIVAGCVILEKNRYLTKIFNNQLILLLGDASYSIYLIHYLVLNVLSLIYTKTKFYWQGDVMIWLQVIVSVIISIAFYKIVEKPLLFRFRYNKSNDVTSKRETVESKELVPL